MSEFVVSARKYRPDTFDSVVGQGSITSTLKNAIRTGSLAHAYLFCGPRGVGKTTCARIFAKTINCKNLRDGIEACNECESCHSFNDNRSFNIHELDAASNNSVDDIRNLIEQVRIPPQVSTYSVYIIDEIHMLSQAAFNAFLKTLEEPPKHAIFILATTEKHKIIPTILSRCQIFDFNRIKINDIVAYLEKISKNESVVYETEALNIIAQKADGAMRDALSIFDQIVSFSDKKITYQSVINNLNVLDFEYYFQLTDHFLKGDYQSSLVLLDEILTKGFDPQNIISGLNKHFREILVAKAEKTLKLLEVGDSVKKRFTDQASDCSNDFLFSCIEICNDCDLSIKSSRNQRLHIEICLIKLCNLTQKKKVELNTGDEDILHLNIEVETNDNSREESVVNFTPEKESEEIIKPESDRVADGTDSVAEGEVPDDPQYVDAQRNKIPSSSGSGTFSIKETLRSVGSLPDEDNGSDGEGAGDTHTIDLVNATSADIDSDAVLGIWDDFVDSLKKNEPRMYSALRSLKPEISEGNRITVFFRNNAQVADFKENIRSLLAADIKDKLGYEEFSIEAEILQDDNEPQAKFLTEKDRLNHMTSKNQALKKLKQEFNLDFE